MMNWYEMPGALDGFENNPEYLEKLTVDVDTKPVERVSYIGKKAMPKAACAWTKKRNYKKKMVRRFLSINPAMDYANLPGMRCACGFYFCSPGFYDSDFHDPKITYRFNPYSHIFLSMRGDLRKYHGTVYVYGSSFDLLAKKKKEEARIINRRIRHHTITEETINCFTCLKKLYKPL